ncbi:MAG: TlpA disulfide reductase family protein [Thermoanaerobaculia bacterium]
MTRSSAPARMSLTALFLTIVSVAPLTIRAGEWTPAGTWHARLIPTPAHDVEFDVRIKAEGDALSALLVNGKSETPFTSTSWDPNAQTLTLVLAHFDASMKAHRKGDALEGTYTRQTASGLLELPFEATRTARKPPVSGKSAPTLDGAWGVEFEDGKSVTKATGLFKQSGAQVTGTLREATGDYGSLHGSFDGNELVLQVFDGVHVYRFDGALEADGTLRGEYRSRNNPPTRWRAGRLTPQAAETNLPDPFTVVKPKDSAAPYRFSFPDSKGQTVTSEDPRFKGKPLIVAFMGTWCPNCNDEAPVLKDLYTRYHAKGLELVALAFEYTADVERNRRQIERFKERYAIEYPVLIAGTTTTAPASPAMTQLEGWQGYPTTLFLDRAHKITKIHSGFDGPATGEHFRKLKSEMEDMVQKLLKK